MIFFWISERLFSAYQHLYLERKKNDELDKNTLKGSSLIDMIKVWVPVSGA